MAVPLFTIDIDTAPLKALAKVLGALNEAMQPRIPYALDQGGSYLYSRSLDALVAAFPGVPPAAMAAALDAIPATPGFNTYTVRTDAASLPYVRWVTMRDEKVCKICGPRDGHVYPLASLAMIYPAHPNCRCNVEPLDLGSELLRAAQVILPEAAQITSLALLDEWARAFGNMQGRIP